METTLPGVFACGNVVHVHDLVDNVTEAGWPARSGPEGLGATAGGDLITTRAGEGFIRGTTQDSCSQFGSQENHALP